VLRESSRIVAAGAINTQATYHLRRWREFLGKGANDWERPGEVAAFYGARSDEELTGAKAATVADVDMLALVSKDDPPVFLFTAQADGPPETRGHYLHHPEHARAVKRACDLAGVSATMWFATSEPRLAGSYNEKLREFLFTHLRVK
jgi:hypothetical protein